MINFAKEISILRHKVHHSLIQPVTVLCVACVSLGDCKVEVARDLGPIAAWQAPLCAWSGPAGPFVFVILKIRISMFIGPCIMLIVE